jgi:hypothetical protein
MTVYRIEVVGELSERYAPAFEGMKMEAKSGRTILTGEVVDQPYLHGILQRINSLGLKLISVESGSGEHEGDAANSPSIANRATWRGLET